MTEAATSKMLGDDVGGANYHMIYGGTYGSLVGAGDRETLSLTRKLLGGLSLQLPGAAPGTESCRSRGPGGGGADEHRPRRL